MENIKSGVAIIILNYNSWQLTIDFIENEISKGTKIFYVGYHGHKL